MPANFAWQRPRRLLGRCGCFLFQECEQILAAHDFQFTQDGLQFGNGGRQLCKGACFGEVDAIDEPVKSAAGGVELDEFIQRQIWIFLGSVADEQQFFAARARHPAPAADICDQSTELFEVDARRRLRLIRSLGFAEEVAEAVRAFRRWKPKLEEGRRIGNINGFGLAIGRLVVVIRGQTEDGAGSERESQQSQTGEAVAGIAERFQHRRTLAWWMAGKSGCNERLFLRLSSGPFPLGFGRGGLGFADGSPATAGLPEPLHVERRFDGEVHFFWMLCEECVRITRCVIHRC